MKNNNFDKRIKIFFAIGVLCFLCLEIRLIYIQIFEHKKLNSMANRQHLETTELLANRGTIYDKRGNKLAFSINLLNVYAIPKIIKNSNEVIEKLSSTLNIDKGELYAKFKNAKLFLVKEGINEKELKAIRKAKFNGIDIAEESKRFYPLNTLACHILGFVGKDNKGLEGLELNCDNILRGEKGFAIIERDGLKREVFLDVQKGNAAQSGHDIHLTIDNVIQHIAERELQKCASTYNAKAGMILVMNPKTGEILALANYPNYNPNEFGSFSSEHFRNRMVVDVFEPGSTFKIVTAGAALEENLITEDSKINCENGTFKIYDREIHDHEKYGWLTFREVMTYSSNIGFVKVGMMLGSKKIFEYARNFNFGNLTFIDLPGESKGVLRKSKEWTKASIAAIPFGQEVSITQIQLACAYASIANNGVMMEPHVIKKITDSQGKTISEPLPKKVRTVVSEKTAKRLQKLLEEVVKNGTGKAGAINKISVAGKTGTAQKIDITTRKYSEYRYVSSFIGFFPVEDPQVLISVIIDEPKGGYWGGYIAAPVFSKTGEEVARYLDIIHSETGKNI